MNPGATITSELYCETLKQLRRVIQNRRRGLLTSDVVLLHDTMQPHASVRTLQLLRQFKWEFFKASAIQSELGPWQFSLVPPPQNFPSIAEFHGQ